MNARYLLLAAVPAFVAIGCQSALYEENLALHGQARELQEDKDRAQAELASRPDQAEVNAQLAAYESELAAKQAQINELEQQLRDSLLAPGLDGLMVPGIDGVEAIYDQETREMTMRVPGDLLFASGSASVSKGAAATLDRISDIIQSDYPGRSIRVEGHTDTDPIRRSKGKYDSNRDLSLRRAYAVTKVLEGSGVPAGQIETVGHGEHKSLGQGKAKDRRVEIIVVTS